ncbi:MAG: iron uptake porin [Prochloraceae cyanobacterium]|nr:iron uptake porin [Prochloraceae cyanobacterium]
MNKIWKFIYLSSFSLSVILLASSDFSARAGEQKKVDNSSFDVINRDRENLETNSLNQITNVNQLRDVSPTDWAFEALRSLVERYGCIVGYPDRTFRGIRALSRYEFAAGLNACLNQIETLIQTTESVLNEDLETLQRLIKEFEAELALISARTDDLENRVAFLEDHQFSTTTKLVGEIIFAAVQVFGEENATTGAELEEQITLNQRTRLSLLTSFTGKDRLRLRLQSGNFLSSPPRGFRGGSNTTGLSIGGNTNNNFILNKFEYRFPIGKRTQLWINAVNFNLDDVANTLAPYTVDAATGAISGFGSYAPIYYTSSGAGAAFSHNFTEQLNLVGFYSALQPDRPNGGVGLFNGQFVAATQLTYQPTDNIGVGVVYSHNYFPGATTGFVSGGFGSFAADDPFNGAATSTDNVALLGTWQISPKFNLEGWGMYARAYAESGIRQGDSADIWNWKLTTAFPDLFAEGNLGAITVGNPPRAYYIEGGGEDRETAWLVEAFYRFKINQYISLTPGAFVITNPEDGRAPLWVGVLRTTFQF